MKVTEIILQIFPWLTPIPTAWLIGRATSVHLQWPIPVAVIAALIIEGLGFSAVAVALMLRNYNASKRQKDPAAPLWVALVLVGVYFVTAVSLTILMDIIPGLAVYAPAIFPVFSLCGMTIAALYFDHRSRLTGIEAEKAERKAERKAAQLAGNNGKNGNRNFPVNSENSESGNLPELATNISDWRQLPADDKALIAGMSTAEIMQHYRVTDRTARNWRTHSINGNGNGNGHN
jgi:hypothetical protein